MPVDVNDEVFGVNPPPASAGEDGAAAIVECYSSYLPSADDVGSRLQVEYTPKRVRAPPMGTTGSALHESLWRSVVVESTGSVGANATVSKQVGHAVSRGYAEFLVVCQLPAAGGTVEDSWCELSLSVKGIDLKPLRGAKAIFSLAHHDSGAQHIAYRMDGDVHDVVEVVLPSDALQVCLFGTLSQMVVQAESAYMRDCVAEAARRFATIGRTLAGVPRARS